jgi:3-isopropylmalate dehydrogenase
MEPPVGGAAYEAAGHPLPESTLKLAKEADAILFGAVGDWKYDTLDRALRPEQAILGLRKPGPVRQLPPGHLLRAADHASSLKPELVAGLDILIIRELTGDIYFGQPRGRRTAVDGHFPGAEEAFDTMRYSRPEIERIAHVAFQAARKRSKRSPAWTRPTCWKPSSSGRTWSPSRTRSTPTSSWSTCTWTTPPCSWSRRPRPSTWW